MLVQKHLYCSGYKGEMDFVNIYNYKSIIYWPRTVLVLIRSKLYICETSVQF